MLFQMSELYLMGRLQTAQFTLTRRWAPKVVAPERGQQCLTDGHWIERPTRDSPERAAGYACQRPFYHRCWAPPRERVPTTPERDSSIANWQWRPSAKGCDDGRDVLAALQQSWLPHNLVGGLIFFLGDSMTQEQFVSLECLLGKSFDAEASRQLCERVGCNEGVCIDRNGTLRHFDARFTARHCRASAREWIVSVQAAAFSTGTRMVYYRLDQFVEAIDAKLRLVPHFPARLLSEASLVVMNTGTHMASSLRSDGKPCLSRRLQEQSVCSSATARTVLQAMRRNTNGSVVYRSSVPGYKRCRNVSRPLHSDAPLELDRDMDYNWATFAGTDHAWHSAVREMNDGRFYFQNVTLASWLRADAHTRPRDDCLHFCLPGVADLWNSDLLGVVVGL
jgi:hypothetical protein